MRIFRFHCKIGTSEEFLDSIDDLMRLQAPMPRGCGYHEIKDRWVTVEAGCMTAGIPPRIAHGGHLSPGHLEVLHRLVAWHQPSTISMRTVLGPEKKVVEVPHAFNFNPGARGFSGHEVLEGADRLIAFMARTGSSARTARRQVLGEAA